VFKGLRLAVSRSPSGRAGADRGSRALDLIFATRKVEGALTGTPAVG